MFSAEQIADEEKKHDVKIHQIDLARAPYSRANIAAYRQLVTLIQKEHIDYIHCNTPTGGLLGRLAGKKCKVKKIIYQAHGFHFYKGAPKKNWLLYYPVEKWLARYTDALITINQEDYEFAKTRLKLRKGGKVYYVPGVGIDTTQYNAEETSRLTKRSELGLKDGEIALISMGDLIERKNYAVAIRAIAEAKSERLHYYICGKGPELNNLKKLAADLGVGEQIHFLGFRTDVRELLGAADLFVFTTKQEGLPRSMMEAMASGLPCVASAIRGNVDLIENGVGGYLCPSNDVEGFAKAIAELAQNPELRQKMKENNLERIKEFDVSVVEREIRAIYQEVLEETSDTKE